MTSPEAERPLSPKQRLDAAKAAFRGSMLENDAFFELLQMRLRESGGTDVALPDFGLEPTIRREEGDTSVIGLRINRSAATSGVVLGELTQGVRVYDYFPLGRMSRTTGGTTLDPEFEAALAAAGKAEDETAEGILQAWQTGLREMGTQFPEPLALDPMSDTFELPDDVGQRNG